MNLLFLTVLALIAFVQCHPASIESSPVEGESLESVNFNALSDEDTDNIRKARAFGGFGGGCCGGGGFGGGFRPGFGGGGFRRPYFGGGGFGRPGFGGGGGFGGGSSSASASASSSSFGGGGGFGGGRRGFG